MRICFLSEIPCRCFVSGLFLGAVDGHERFLELSPADAHLAEFISPGFVPVRFLLDEEFFLHPPEGVRLYLTGECTAVYVYGFVREGSELRPILQERQGDVLLTLYRQGGVHLSLQGKEGFFLADLPEAFAEAKISRAGDCFLLEAPQNFCFISERGEVLTSSEGTVTERGPSVSAKVPLHDCLRHTALCRYEGGKLVSCTLLEGRTAPRELYPVALLEAVLFGGDPLPYLAECLREKADALREFLGPFREVVATDRADIAGLVYPLRERVFSVRYYRLTQEEDGRISNLTPI